MNFLDGISEKLMDTLGIKVSDILKNDKKNIQKVQVITEPFTYGLTKVKRGSTSVTVKPDEAQISITNNLKADVRITAITIIPDSSFKTNGLLKLTVDEVTVLEIDTAGNLTDLNNLPLSIPNEGWLIKRDEKIELYMWSSSGTITATLIVHFQR